MKIEKAEKKKERKRSKKKEKQWIIYNIRNAFPSFIVDDDETWKSSKKQEQRTKEQRTKNKV
jgi:hypothetical protein